MKMCNHNYIFVHQQVSIKVWEDPNTDKITNHVFHDMWLECQLCSEKVPIKAIVPRNEQLEMSAEEFKEFLLTFNGEVTT